VFLSLVHGGVTSGHFGRKHTAAVIQSRVYWPSWVSDLDAFLKACMPCKCYHRGAIPRRAGLKLSPVGEPWERVSLDITGPHLHSSTNKQYTG